MRPVLICNNHCVRILQLLQSMHMIKGCAVRYVMMPMARLMTNDVLLDPEFDPTEAIEEPQVMFRCDAREEVSHD